MKLTKINDKELTYESCCLTVYRSNCIHVQSAATDSETIQAQKNNCQTNMMTPSC